MKKRAASCPEEGAVPLLGPGGSTQPGWAARPWVPLCFLSSVPQAPMYLVGQQTLSLVLASRLKGQVPPTGAQSHQQGLQPPRGSLVSIYNKIVGDNLPVLVFDLILLDPWEGGREAVGVHR